MEVIKAHVLAYVDAPHAVLTEHKAVGTLADEAAVRVDARSSLADPTTVLALVHICQHACVCIADIWIPSKLDVVQWTFLYEHFELSNKNPFMGGVGSYKSFLSNR